MNVAVIGVGAVGGYFGARLAEAGHAVTFIARGETLRALRAAGLRVESPAGDVDLTDVQVTDDPSRVEPVELVVLGVKAWQVPEAAGAARPLLGPDTAILPLQNGIEAPAQISDTVGAAHALGGLCRIICAVGQPGTVRHLGADPTIVLGELDDSRSERVGRIVAAFEPAVGATALIADDIMAEMWKKLVLITATSGVGATARVPFGEVRAAPETRRLLRDCMAEVVCVAGAAGSHLPGDLPDRLMDFVDGLPADGVPSMQRDIEQGRPSELDAQLGAVRRAGRATATPTPIVDTLYAALLPLELRARRAAT